MPDRSARNYKTLTPHGVPYFTASKNRGVHRLAQGHINVPDGSTILLQHIVGLPYLPNEHPCKHA